MLRRDPSARLVQDDRSGSDVPRLQGVLDIPIDPAGGDVGKVECCSSQPADPPGTLEYANHRGAVLLCLLPSVVRKTDRDQRLVQARSFRNRHRRPVEGCSGAPPGGKELVMHHVNNDADKPGRSFVQSNTHGDVGEAVNEVDGAVERIDDPGSPARCVTTLFFADDGVVGTMLGKHGSNERFSCPINCGHRIDGTFELGGSGGRKVAPNDGRSLLGRHLGEFEIGHHDTLSESWVVQSPPVTDSMAGWPPVLMAFLAGLLLTLAYPPVGWVPLAVVGPALFLAAIRRCRSVSMALAVGVLFGSVFMGSLMWWLVNLGWEALVGLIISQVTFFALFAMLGYAFRGQTGWKWVVVVSGGWAAAEFARARLPFGGLEWGALGYPAGELAWMRDVAPWIGTSGWGVIFATLAALVVPWTSWRPFIVGVVAVFLLAGAAAILATGPEGEVLRVAIVQGNTPCAEHCIGERQGIFDSHLELTRQIAPGTVDLVAWAESATTFDPLAASEQRDLVAAEAVRLDAHLIVGGDRPDSDSTFVNSIVVFDPDGRYQTEIRKIHPVPFGEYVPVRSLFGRLSVTDQVPRDMVRGEGPVLADIGGIPVGSLISFEVAFARYARDAVAAGGEVLVVASNEASYGESPASDQLIGMSRMRSAELGVDVIHGAITGSSTIITQGGSVMAPTGLYEATVIDGEIRGIGARKTLYTRWGDWVAVAAMSSAALVVMWSAMLAASDRPARSLRPAG